MHRLPNIQNSVLSLPLHLKPRNMTRYRHHLRVHPHLSPLSCHHLLFGKIFARQSYDAKSAELLDELDELQRFTTRLNDDYQVKTDLLSSLDAELQEARQKLRDLEAQESFSVRLKERILRADAMHTELESAQSQCEMWRRKHERLQEEYTFVRDSCEKISAANQVLYRVLRRQQQRGLADIRAFLHATEHHCPDV